MDDYTREMMDLKTLVTRTLEKKGVLAKIRAELRASVFEAIEDEDRAVENEDNVPPALLGSCNDRAKQLHASPSGRLLTALVCEYLDWAQLGHTLKVYLPECNLPKDSWKAELRDFSSKNGFDLNRNGESGPMLLDVLEGFLKFETLSHTRSTGRRTIVPETEISSHMEPRTNRRPSSSSVASGLPPLGRPVPASQATDRRIGSSLGGYRKDEYTWRYDDNELSEDVIRATSALENIQLDRKARSLTSSWRGREISQNGVAQLGPGMVLHLHVKGTYRAKKNLNLCLGKRIDTELD
ncbi:Protein TONNEAU 1b [Acorus calamus]|uniref:Protein TONNEAU 1b n=1 Tax=Acorus calamus TaxID=4465 RepID=A0AAV9F2U5_ACOCL|nr:Protein TONNEAU 1b [Acorus calamus]